MIPKRIKKAEKDGERWAIHHRILLIAITLAVFSLSGKIMSFLHWMANGFDMSSYHPLSPFIYLPASIITLCYSFWKRDAVFETVSIIGFIYTFLLVLGIVDTYYFSWVWW